MGVTSNQQAYAERLVVGLEHSKRYIIKFRPNGVTMRRVTVDHVEVWSSANTKSWKLSGDWCFGWFVPPDTGEVTVRFITEGSSLPNNWGPSVELEPASASYNGPEKVANLPESARSYSSSDAETAPDSTLDSLSGWQAETSAVQPEITFDAQNLVRVVGVVTQPYAIKAKGESQPQWVKTFTVSTSVDGNTYADQGTFTATLDSIEGCQGAVDPVSSCWATKTVSKFDGGG